MKRTRELISIIAILIAFNLSPKDCYSIYLSTSYNSELPENLSQWELYFKNNISVTDNIEGIYLSKLYSIKYYNNQLKFRNPTPNVKDVNHFVIKKNEKGEYERYAVTSEQSVKFDILLRIGNTNKFIFKDISFLEVFFINSEVSVNYTNNEFVFSYNLPYKEIYDEYQRENNKSRNRISNDLIAALARNTKRIVEQQMLKIYPTFEMYESHNNNNNNNKTSKSGTGFAISSDGYIVTNYHLIENSSSILVKGINQNFSTSLVAEVVLSDKNNDLAIIKIIDKRFNSLGNIPYLINNQLANVGENIFVLGYPLRASMGDEIKLTNGIISSRTGYQGDVTLYQISAAVQPGNSGGPLFDSNGNIIGIIASKHTEAENVSYAIKSNYLVNLISLMSNISSTPAANSLKGKTLSEQVRIAKDYVYIIDVK